MLLCFYPIHVYIYIVVSSISWKLESNYFCEVVFAIRLKLVVYESIDLKL